ncbi:ParB N-terminal domain-containing protein [Roseovarius sp. M141]|uniref:ParB/RepB/Spo0J family partition protein n=1 Tax=Roseovarius sp. M141 TaxID=2583806 RepID=UPI0020CF550C|nr:ParB N-terminal domain-containing protein [Roseovarius sp. M141]MCQ0090563.1 chromosome partitioning protein [Roseovarius sp. M141]
MAKRKRLTPAQPGTPVPTERSASAAPLAPLGRAPIAQVAGDASITAAFEMVRDELQSARREGRMVLALPLKSVRADYLIRDRLVCDADEMEALKQSIRQRGQQTPIEVTDLGQGDYGLISGWRRLQALSELHEESGGLERFGVIQALLRLPEDRPAAYIAMLEENEVRANLSFYERARIVVQAVQADVFESDKKALQSLFSTASFSKRSKVKSFMPLVRALDGALRYPAQIPERLGLTLSRTISDDPGVAQALKQVLSRADVASAEDERMILERSQSRPDASKPKAGKPRSSDAAATGRQVDTALAAQGLSISFARGRIVLEGKGVNSDLNDDLTAWLKSRQQ